MPASPPRRPGPVLPREDPASRTRPSGAAHRMRVTLLMAGSCLPILGAVLIAPVLPSMQDHFEHSAGASVLVPLVLTVPALALAVLAPVAGAVVDRFGRRRLLLAATVLYAVFGVVPLWADSLEVILAGRVLVGVTEAAIMTCCTTLIGDYYSGPARDRYLALQTMCSAASATVFFVLGGAVGSAGWRTPFWLYAVGLLIAPAMAVTLRRPGHNAPAVTPAGAAGRSSPGLLRAMLGMCVLTAFGAVVFYTVPVEMSYLLDDLGVTSTGVIGAATALASAATVLGSVLFTRVERIRAQGPAAVLAVCAVGFAVIGLAGHPVLLLLGAVVNCLATGVLLPLLLSTAMARLDYADRGRGTGWWTASFFAGEFLCPLVLLAVQSTVGSIALAVGVLGLVTAAVAAVLRVAASRSA